VVSKMTGLSGLFSISYMGCHPKTIDELMFFKVVQTINQSYNLPYTVYRTVNYHGDIMGI
jgi:hypothetical protein